MADITLDDVITDSQRYGPFAYLATTSASATPYVSPASVAWVDDTLCAFVASGSAKVANVRANPSMCVHFAVGESTNWDSCIVWGDVEIVDTAEGRGELWGRMGYDLSQFEPGGPESDGHVFLRLVPTKAVVLRTYGMAGRDTWAA
jgi:nitroimidazol reductase NimA-like FMN-containing flavoprotein (pyridoxamine 5'-phosphate oxidase superfamily)